MKIKEVIQFSINVLLVLRYTVITTSGCCCMHAKPFEILDLYLTPSLLKTPSEEKMVHRGSRPSQTDPSLPNHLHTKKKLTVLPALW